MLLVKPSGWSASNAKDYPRGPRRIQREWSCSGAAPPLHVLRTRWIGDVYPTYSGEGPSRTNSQGSHTAAALSLFPPKPSGLNSPRSIFHASMKSSTGPSPHEFPIPSLSITCVWPPGSRLLFPIDSGSGCIPITLYMRPGRRSRAANRFPTDSLLDQGSMSEHVRRLAAAKLSIKPFTRRTVAPAPEYGE